MTIKNIKIYSKFFEVLLIFVLSLTPLLWLASGEIVLGHDSGFRLNPSQHLINLFYSLDPSNNFGYDWSAFKGFLITQAPEALFTAITGSLSAGQILTFILWFFLIGLSMYIFINSFFPDKAYWVFRLFGSTFYMYNFFLLQGWFIAERAKFSLIAALPLGLLILYKTITKEYGLQKGTIFFSLTFFFLNGGGSPPFYGSLLIIYGITFLYLTVESIKKHGYKELIYSLKVVLLFFAGFFIINAYWILPQLRLFINNYNSVLSGSGGIEGIINWEATISQHASFINLFRLQGIPDWYGNDHHRYANEFINNPILILASFIPFFIILYGLYVYRRERTNNYKLRNLIFIMILISFLFTAGGHSPFGFLYTFLILHIPGFAIFRSSFYKFGPMYWFSFIFLVGFFLNLLLLYFVKRKIIYSLLGIVAIVAILAYHHPFFISNFFAWQDPFTTKVKIPNYVFQMAKRINTTDVFSRILLLPKFDPGFGSDLYSWGFWSHDALPRLFTDRSIVSNSSRYPKIVENIYEAISRNDENSFLRLAGISGINRVLWRDDVLYSDKSTKSKNFINLKNNLEKFAGVIREKTYGAWTFYRITSPYYLPIFYSSDTTIYSQSKSLSLNDVLSDDKTQRKQVVLFTESIKNKDQKVRSLSYKDIVEAECILCTQEESNMHKGGLKMPDITLLPGSTFYFISTWKEQKAYEINKNDPISRIDYDLGYASKRIAEMKEITKAKLKYNSRMLVKQAIERYTSLIEDSIKQASLLPEYQRNKQFIKIQSYLNSHYKHLGLEPNLYESALEDFESLSLFIQNHLTDLESKSWFTNTQESQIKYSILIENSGNYSFHIVDKTPQPKNIEIDGISVLEKDNIFLTKGVHRLNLIYPSFQNLLNASESGELILPFGKRRKFSIKDYSQKDTYVIRFDYKIISGRLGASIVQERKNEKIKQDITFTQNSIWNSLSFVLNPLPNTTSLELQFYPTGFETSGAIVQTKNLTVTKTFIPKVFFSKTLPISDRQLPRISFKMADPTKYLVYIENATNPYILNFGESYSDEWRGYILNGSDDPLLQKQHYIVNGYANGWYIDKLGNYTIMIEYYSQRVFYIGLLLSSASLVIFIALLLSNTKSQKNG